MNIRNRIHAAMHSIHPLRRGTLVLAAAAVLAAGAARAGTIILDTFTSGSWVVGDVGAHPGYHRPARQQMDRP